MKKTVIGITVVGKDREGIVATFTNFAFSKGGNIEKDKKYGIQKFSCIKDEFGLITISGQFNNDKIKKDKVSLEIMFLDHENNVILKNTANLGWTPKYINVNEIYNYVSHILNYINKNIKYIIFHSNYLYF